MLAMFILDQRNIHYSKNKIAHIVTKGKIMRREDIKAGLRVVDLRNTPNTSYTWIAGAEFIDGTLYQYYCEACHFLDQFMLREDKVVRGHQLILCIECAGIDDLEPIAQAVK
jgi:hypothetical protein